MVDEFGLRRMDATEPLVLQQQRMREIVRPYLDGVTRVDGNGLTEALKVAGLMGEYVLSERPRRHEQPSA